MNATLGEKRVYKRFNPAKNEMVEQIKKKSAELIDLIEELRTEGCTSEKHRLISHAQTEIQTAKFYAVDACYTD